MEATLKVFGGGLGGKPFYRKVPPSFYFNPIINRSF